MSLQEGLRLACQHMTLQPGLLSAQNTARLLTSSAVLCRYRLPMQPPERQVEGKSTAVQLQG